MAFFDKGKEDMPILSQDLADFLESEALITPIKNKKRQLSPTLLSSPSPPHKRKFEKIGKDTATLTIPETLHSLETFQFLGYNEQTSQELWDTLCRMISFGYEENVLSISNNHIQVCPINASSNEDDWSACLDALGVESTLADAIMDPVFTQKRCSASCQFWMADTTLGRWEFLLGLECTLTEATATIWPVHTDHRTSQAESIPEQKESTPEQKKSDKAPPSEGLAHEGDRDVRAKCDISEKPMPDHMDHHTMLWRGGLKELQDKFYVASQGVFDCDRIAASPGDFSARRKVAYWTPQRECAEEYRKYAARRNPGMATSIIQVAIHEDVTRTLTETQLFTEADDTFDVWREYVWYGRHGKSRIPETLKRFDQVDLIMGHIATGIHSKYTSLDDWRKIKKSDRMMITTTDGEDRLAVQWVFRSEKAQFAFEDNIHGKVYFHHYDVGM